MGPPKLSISNNKKVTAHQKKAKTHPFTARALTSTISADLFWRSVGDVSLRYSSTSIQNRMFSAQCCCSQNCTNHFRSGPPNTSAKEGGCAIVRPLPSRKNSGLFVLLFTFTTTA